MKSPILATGIQGLVGSKIAADFNDRYDFVSLDIHDPQQPIDITDLNQVKRAFTQSPAKFVIHLAAFTDVTAAWQQQNDKSGPAYQVNVVGTENIVEAAAETDKHVIHISTSYIFDGQKSQPYVETDQTHPIEWYGQTKLWAEEKVQASRSPWTILRIDQPFRSDTFPKPDAVRKSVAMMARPEPVKLFADHYFGPTYINDLARVVDWVIRTNTTGIFHASSGEQWSDFQFAEAICRLLKIEPHFEKGNLQEYLATSQRPYQINSAMNCQKLKSQLDFELLSVEVALAQVILSL